MPPATLRRAWRRGRRADRARARQPASSPGIAPSPRARAPRTRPARRARVFDHPLTKWLRDHRPTVVEPILVMEERAIGVGRLRRDPVDHRVWEAARRLDVANEIAAASLAHARYSRPRDIAVSRQV